MASDDGPVETMPNMSPSCTRVRAMRLNRSRMRPVLRKSRCRSSTMMQEDAAGGVVARARRRQDDALLRRRRRRRLQVEDAAAVDQRHRRHVLLDAVLVDLDLVLREIGDELIPAVANDDVGGHEIDGDAEVGRASGCAGAGRRRAGVRRRRGLPRRRYGGGPQHHAEREPGTGGGEAAVGHDRQYRPLRTVADGGRPGPGTQSSPGSSVRRTASTSASIRAIPPSTA